MRKSLHLELVRLNFVREWVQLSGYENERRGSKLIKGGCLEIGVEVGLLP